jgi:cytochrome c peroxidase
VFISMLVLGLFACDSQAPVAEPPAPAPAPVEEPAPPPAEPVADGVPRGLPGLPPVPADNPMSPAKVALGHELFMDTRLSVDGSRSCYSCHVNERGNADGRKLALGAGDKPLTRNTPTIWNVGYLTSQYWDGRAPTLEAQALGAWKGGNMGVGADNLPAKAAEIGALPEYAARFREVFGLAEADAVTPDHVAMALSAYERTLLCGDPETWSEEATRGKAIFEGKGRCVACHSGPQYSDGLYHNIGLGGEDVGRAAATKDDADKGKFRTPTLRNVSRTAPYFHDGRAATLEEAVRYMAGGGNPADPGNDPILQPTALADAEITDVVAYLTALECTGTLEVKGDPKPVALE